MPITIDGNGTIGGASTLSTTVASPTFTTPNINSAQFASVSGTAPLYSARAWVNFNGTGTVAIRASGNVSSITDNGTGQYTVNFATAMPDVNYALTVSAADGNSNGADCRGPTTAPSVSSVQVQTTNNGQTVFLDLLHVAVAIFR